MIFKRILAFAAGIAIVLMTGPANAQSYPSHAVTLIVPPGAGGGTDVLFRALAKATEPFLGQPVLVVNRPGAGGAIGTAEIARAKPDGYTIGAVLQQIYLPMMRPELTYRVKDFTYIMMVNTDPLVFTVKGDSKWKTMSDLIAAAKEAPGKITIGNCGSGCNSHIAAALMAKNAGIQLTYVPFDGHAPGRTALLGGHLDVMMLTPGEAIDYIKSGQLRGLAVTADKRFEGLDVPTLKEAAGFDVVGVSWRAIGGPAGMPADVVAKLADAFKKGMETADFQDFAKKGGFPLVYMNTATMTAFIAKESAAWEQTLKDIGLYKAQ
jgi:tripartite-type tricarboxylate transporter receptor subunit TctC